MITRRSFLCTGTALFANEWLPAQTHAVPTQRFAALPESLAHLEHSSGGRLGVGILDTGTGERAGYRADERFPMCSTFKVLLVGSVLQRVDANRERLGREVSVPAKPLLSHSPLTEEHAGGTMSVEALCHAALTQSDNTAANLLLEATDGPAGLTGFARSLGDSLTRLDRTETLLNESLPGDPRDTTTPAAMTQTLQALLLGKALTAASRDRLTQWMVENKYGEDRLRANLPQGWRAADKTGSNGETTSNDIGVYWPAAGAPVVVAAYLTECAGPETKRGAALASVGRVVMAAMQAHG